MFTGLVLGLGEISDIRLSGEQARLAIRPLFPMKNYIQGESIAINGVCLSVETFQDNEFTAYASKETMSLTNLKHLGRKSLVNLERALALGDRLGGHMVSGHVDGLATIESISQVGDSLKVRMCIPESFSSQVIAKGSIALDGISLTINLCQENFFEVNVIPETQKTTTMQYWKVGQELNFETDMIGKYVQKMLQAYGVPEKKSSSITMDFLRENGF